MWDLKCLAAALCFLTSNVLFVVHGALLMRGSDSQESASDAALHDAAYDASKENSAVHPTSFNFDYWKELDPAYIESRWAEREEQRPILMSAAVGVVYLQLMHLISM